MDQIQKWLSGKKTYLVAILAIIGAIAAWAAGELTNVQAVEAVVAAIITATMRAGVAKSGPMSMKLIIPFLLPLVLMGGCTGMQWNNTQTWTPEGQLAAAYETFDGTTKSLTIVVQTGKLSKAEATEILNIVKAGQQCLDLWRAALDLKLPTSTIIEQWNVIIQEMLAKRIAAERKAVAMPAAAPTVPTRLLDLAA